MEPGSPSAPLATTTGVPPSTRTARHFAAAGNQPPPRPRRPEASSLSMIIGKGKALILQRFARGRLSRCRPFPVRWELGKNGARGMINITTTATQKVKGILEQEKENIPQGGLRIYVQRGGCSGFSYGMVLDEATEEDQVFETDGIKVCDDPMSMRYLDGAEVDYKEDLMGGGSAIKNPNATST